VSDNDGGRREGKDREKDATERGWRRVTVEGEGDAAVERERGRRVKDEI
jgi:hypothetical protein